LKKNNSKNEVAISGIKLRSLLNLHRRMGIISAFFVIILSLSGLVLHYGPNLNLDTQFIRSNFLLNWYDIEAPSISVSYTAESNNITHLADALYFNEQRIPGSFTELNGMVATEFGFVIATNNQLILITEDGELVEVLGNLVDIPSDIQQIGSDLNGAIFLQRSDELISIDLNTLDLSSVPEGASVAWSDIENVGLVKSEILQTNYRASLVSWERILLDIHSGRIFGTLGVILVDVMAVLFLLMAFTGIWIWSRRRS